jgi:hypothetical protein
MVPCSFNTKEIIEMAEVLECKGGVKIIDELSDNYWM